MRVLQILALSLLLSSWSSGARAADLKAGEKVYLANCMACHGMQADGKGPAAAALQPPPADFTNPTFWATRSNDQVKAVIKSGKPGTPMMPFAQLSATDVDNLVAYLRSKGGT